MPHPHSRAVISLRMFAHDNLPIQITAQRLRPIEQDNSLAYDTRGCLVLRYSHMSYMNGPRNPRAVMVGPTSGCSNTRPGRRGRVYPVMCSRQASEFARLSVRIATHVPATLRPPDVRLTYDPAFSRTRSRRR
ncbi:hypothetical protein BDV93DRAFT_524693, partial [Ceratobasidium sp. AG-I]